MFCKVRQVKAFLTGAALGAMMLGAGYMASQPQLRRTMRKKGKKVASAIQDWCDDMF
jgi:hypothetical protein